MYQKYSKTPILFIVCKYNFLNTMIYLIVEQY